jgi:Flp pilus assembly protein TadD
VTDSFQELNNTFTNQELLYRTNILCIYREAHLNFSLAQIRLNNYETAIDNLTLLLHYEPTNVKALYLRGKAA